MRAAVAFLAMVSLFALAGLWACIVGEDWDT